MRWTLRNVTLFFWGGGGDTRRPITRIMTFGTNLSNLLPCVTAARPGCAARTAAQAAGGCKHGAAAAAAYRPHILFWWRRATFSRRHLQNAQVSGSPTAAPWIMQPPDLSHCTEQRDRTGALASICAYLRRKRRTGHRRGKNTKHAQWPRNKWQPLYRFTWRRTDSAITSRAYLQRAYLLLCQVVGCGTFGP